MSAVFLVRPSTVALEKEAKDAALEPTREPPRRSSSRPRTMVWTAQTSTLGPPLVVEHGDICLGLYGEDSWWPLRVQTDGRAARLGPTVEVLFFGNTQTNRWARNKLRPFSDLDSIPSRSMPNRCAAPGCPVPPTISRPRSHSTHVCPIHALYQPTHACPTQRGVPDSHQGG